jgi:hypothetical protein
MRYKTGKPGSPIKGCVKEKNTSPAEKDKEIGSDHGERLVIEDLC